MKIEKAIEILSRLAAYLNKGEDLDRALAINLGIQALKRCKHEKEGTFKNCWNPLPGETED